MPKIEAPAVEGDAAVREFTEAITELLANHGLREKLARRAKQLVTDNRGATEKTLQLIAPLLSTRQPGRSQSDSILADAHTS